MRSVVGALLALSITTPTFAATILSDPEPRIIPPSPAEEQHVTDVVKSCSDYYTALIAHAKQQAQEKNEPVRWLLQKGENGAVQEVSEKEFFEENTLACVVTILSKEGGGYDPKTIT